MDPGFWDPVLLQQLSAFSQTMYPWISLGELRPYLSYGPIVVGSRMPAGDYGPYFINTPHFQPTGFDRLTVHIPEDSEWNHPRGRVQYGDVLIVRSGMATLGRTLAYLTHASAVVGCYVTIIRQDRIHPCYLATLLKSDIGQLQIQRLKHGAGTVNLSFAQIRNIWIPLISERDQEELVQRYLLMDRFHREGQLGEAHEALGQLMRQLNAILGWG